MSADTAGPPDWREAAAELPYPDELCQGVVDVRSSGHKEATAGAQIVEEEQLLVLGKKTKLLSTRWENESLEASVCRVTTECRRNT